MMGIVVSETCWAYKKYNKISSGIYLVFVLQLPVVTYPYLRTNAHRVMVKLQLTVQDSLRSSVTSSLKII